jgi:hypothetical protein
MLPIKYDLNRIGTTPGQCSAGFLQHFHDWRRRRCGFPAILIRGITYKLQERAYGGLSAADRAKAGAGHRRSVENLQLLSISCSLQTRERPAHHLGFRKLSSPYRLIQSVATGPEF